MIHGDKDDLVPLQHSKDVYAAFQEAGVTTDLIVLPGAGHGFQGEDAKKAADALVAWFEKYLVK
jgi:dipeptidyl aminopeptidase/acylaminoacyl peptidase